MSEFTLTVYGLSASVKRQRLLDQINNKTKT